MLRAKVIQIPDPYFFDLDQHGLLAVSEKNISLGDALIRYDSSYGPAEDTDDESLYSGMLHKNGLPETYEEILKIVKSIDKINSTHLAAEGESQGKESRRAGREKTAKAIESIADFKVKLASGNVSLVKSIALVEGVDRNNFSFATKYCAFTSLYALQQDKYCIYDRVLMQVLPYYAFMYLEGDAYKEYCTKNGTSRLDEQFRQTCDYDGYRNLVNDIIKGIASVTGIPLPYRTFDKLLWYFYKGRDKKIKTAKKILREAWQESTVL